MLAFHLANGVLAVTLLVACLPWQSWRRRPPAVLAALAVFMVGCGAGGDGDGGDPGGQPPPLQPITFSALPMALADIEEIAPLGNVNPPGHTFPSDHIGLTHTLAAPVPDGAYEVFAPAGGYVRAIRTNGDDGIEVGPQPVDEPGGERTWYFMGHLKLDPGIEVGTLLSAGQRIGTNSDLAFGVDLGLVDQTVTNGFVRIERYGDKQAHGVRPLSRFTPALRAQLVPLVARTGANDEDGQFVYDVVARLKGNWFHETLPYDQSAETSPGSWSRHLAFVEDPARAGDAFLVTGGFTTGESGIYPIPPTDVLFADVGTASGQVLYESHVGLLRWWEMAATPNRWFLVELTDAETLTFEMFTTGPPSDFTAAAAVFKR